MAAYRVLSWDGIPSLLKVLEDGRRPLSVPLSDCSAEEVAVGILAEIEAEWAPARTHRNPAG